MYTFDYKSCKDCPTGGNCTQGILAEVLPGYWRETNITDVTL